MIAAALRLFSGRALRCGFVALGRADLWWPWAFLTDSIGWKSAGRAAVRRLERRGQPEWLAARKVVRFLELLEEELQRELKYARIDGSSQNRAHPRVLRHIAVLQIGKLWVIEGVIKLGPELQVLGFANLD